MAKRFKTIEADGKQILDVLNEAITEVKEVRKSGRRVDGVYVILDCNEKIIRSSSRMRRDTRFFMIEMAKQIELSNSG